MFYWYRIVNNGAYCYDGKIYKYLQYFNDYFIKYRPNITIKSSKCGGK